MNKYITTIILKKGHELTTVNENKEQEIISRLHVESIEGIHLIGKNRFFRIRNLEGQSFYIPSEAVAIISEQEPKDNS